MTKGEAMNETMLTLVGNLTEDPRLTHLDSGYDVVNFRMAATARRFDFQSKEYVDADPLFINVTCWRALATNVNASLHKGDPIVVKGTLRQRSYETEDNQKRTKYELIADAVGPNLRMGMIKEFIRQRSGGDSTVAQSTTESPVAESTVQAA